MKKILIIIAVLSGAFSVQAQENRLFYYHTQGEKIYLDKIENTKIIHFEKSIDSPQKNDICSQLKNSGYTVTEINSFMYRVSGNTISLDNNFIISKAKESGNILCISDMLMYKDSTIQWFSNKIIVKIHPDSDLQDVLSKSKIPIIDFKQIGYCKQTYVVELNVTENSAIEYANMLSERGNVVWAQPSFWRLVRKHNPYYASQWGLNNTGQNGGTPGIDIKAEPAWSIATGSGIKVAVLDEGVDLNHPDLKDNLLSGYDATDALYGGSDGGYGGNNGCASADAHGTACAGIIAAKDNNIGIKGIAYDAKIIPVRVGYTVSYMIEIVNICMSDYFMEDSWVADGFYKAWHDYGADVLSNSWGLGSSALIVDEAIDDALTYGRNGKGCVVVFATGNSNTSVAYPASLSNVIAVGAISPCGERKSPSSCDGQNWGSNYGQTLDVVAPGVLTPTTDIQGSAGYNTASYTAGDYFSGFGGTSAACPHVAGVAALILSVNPNLTVQQVRDIIESTAQKINKYHRITNPSGYTYFSQFPLSKTWNNEVGYGLVDASAAVSAALATLVTIVGTDTLCTNTTYTLTGVPSGLTVSNTSWTTSGAVAISSSASQSVVVKSNIPLITATYPLPSLAVCPLSGSISATVTINGVNNVISPKSLTVDCPSGTIAGPMDVGTWFPLQPTQAGYYKFTAGSDVPSSATVRWVAAPVNSSNPNATATLYSGHSANIYLDCGLNEVRMQYEYNGVNSNPSVKQVLVTCPRSPVTDTTNSGIDAEELSAMNELKVKLSPNPVVNSLNVTVEDATPPIDVTVYSSSGTMYLSQTFSTSTFTVDLSRCQPGMLVVRISSGNKHVVKNILKL